LRWVARRVSGEYQQPFDVRASTDLRLRTCSRILKTISMEPVQLRENTSTPIVSIQSDILATAQI